MASHRLPGRLPQIDPQRCTGCGRCVAVCAPHVLWLDKVADWQKAAQLHDAAGCTGCSLCAVTCPFHAIRMVVAPVAGPVAVPPPAPAAGAAAEVIR